MRYFIIRTLVNALALAITIAVLPWITVRPIAAEELAATYILLGIVFGLINALVRPVVLFFTARSQAADNAVDIKPRRPRRHPTVSRGASTKTPSSIDHASIFHKRLPTATDVKAKVHRHLI